MQRFRVEAGAVEAARARAAALSASASAAELATRAGAGATLVDEELAALLLSPHVSTEALLAIAAARRPAGRPHLETFSPLYLTNECDAECLMCGMRRTNDDLVRETADAAAAEAQLDILHRRGLRAPRSRAASRTSSSTSGRSTHPSTRRCSPAYRAGRTGVSRRASPCAPSRRPTAGRSTHASWGRTPRTRAATSRAGSRTSTAPAPPACGSRTR